MVYRSSFRGLFHKLIYALRQTICALRQSLKKLFTGAKVQGKAQKIGVGPKTVYVIDPRSPCKRIKELNDISVKESSILFLKGNNAESLR